MTSKNNKIQEYLSEQIALIVEPSNAFAQVIQASLVQFGVRPDKIFSASTYSDAVSIIAQMKPKILITEYLIGKHLGLALVEKQDEHYDPLLRISIIVTKESSDNAVAEAAEEQLDAYIVKPFSGADFQQRFLETVKRKIQPSDYLMKIREGKELLAANKVSAAIEIFKEAKSISQKPTLANYYLGTCYLQVKDNEKARKEFAEGRSYNPLHYKCLTGEFDCLILENKYKQAYELSLLIRENFPVTSARLGKFFVATVYTEQFNDLQELYDLYTRLDNRPAELVNLVSISLLTAGRYFLRNNKTSQALDFFEMGSVATGRDISFLEKVIDDLLKINDINSAEKYLKLTKSDDLGTAKHTQLTFKIVRYSSSPDAVIELGRKMVFDGKASPEVLKILVETLMKSGKKTLAESIIIKGCESFPEVRKELYELFDKYN